MITSKQFNLFGVKFLNMQKIIILPIYRQEDSKVGRTTIKTHVLWEWFSLDIEKDQSS